MQVKTLMMYSYSIRNRFSLFIFMLSLNYSVVGQPDSCLVAIADDFDVFLTNAYNGHFELSEDLDTCDLNNGLRFLAKNYIHRYPNGEKSTYYLHTYRGHSTNAIKFKPRDPESSYSPRDSVNSQFLPLDMFLLYYISAAYHEDFGFRKSVSLGLDSEHRIVPVPIRDHDYPIKKKAYRRNKRILREAEKSLDQWLDLLNQYGIDHLRKEKITPLSFSDLKWLDSVTSPENE